MGLDILTFDSTFEKTTPEQRHRGQKRYCAKKLCQATHLHVINGVRRLDLERDRDRLASEGFHKDLCYRKLDCWDQLGRQETKWRWNPVQGMFFERVLRVQVPSM
jgi:hypothetical protein